MGPDAARYLIAAQGHPVARPFHLRWLLPAVCKNDIRRWWIVWALSWPLLAGSVFWLAADLGWQRAVFAAVLTVGLPGVWGPAAVRPVGVDLPAMAVTALAAACAVHGLVWAAIVLVVLAAQIKETAPVWAALWAWNPILLVGLMWVAFNAVVIRSGVDEVTRREPFATIHRHPFRTAIAARKGRWRDGWLWVAPWGVCLAGLYQIDWRLAAVLAVAHLQVLVATDTVRLLHTAAGPAIALAAAAVIPIPWLAVAAVAHLFWYRQPEVI